MLGPILWQYLFMFSCYYFWKSCIGTLADSIGGFIKKVELENHFDNDDEYDNELEEFDKIGNISKMETRIFAGVIVFITLIYNMKSYGFVIAIYLLLAVIIQMFLLLWKKLSDNVQYTTKEIFSSISKSVMYFLTIFLLVLIRLMYQCKNNNLIYESIASIAYGSLIISIISAIFGGLLDIYKKYSNDDRLSASTKKAFIVHDLLGDISKDVICFIMFTISIIIMFAIICI